METESKPLKTKGTKLKAQKWLCKSGDKSKQYGTRTNRKKPPCRQPLALVVIHYTEDHWKLKSRANNGWGQQLSSWEGWTNKMGRCCYLLVNMLYIHFAMYSPSDFAQPQQIERRIRQEVFRCLISYYCRAGVSVGGNIICKQKSSTASSSLGYKFLHSMVSFFLQHFHFTRRSILKWHLPVAVFEMAQTTST